MTIGSRREAADNRVATGPGGKSFFGSRRRPVLARSVWVFVTQCVSSASNFTLTLFVLASATPREFGTFSVCLTSYLLIVQLTRTGLSVPLLVLYSDRAPKEVSVESRSALGLAIVVGLLAAGAFIASTLVYPDARGILVVLSLALPFLLYQDVIRHVAIARGQPRFAAFGDALWLTLQLLGSVLVVLRSRDSPAALVGIWGVAGCVSGITIGWHLRARPGLRGTGPWLRAHRSLLTRMLAEFGLNSGSFYALSYGVVLLAGAEQLGRLRAAQVLIGPVSVLVLSGVALGVPESVRVRHDKLALRRFAGRLAVFLAAAALLGGGISYALLPTIGPSMFPEIWSYARPLIPLLTIYSIAVGISIGALSALRALDEVGWIVRGRLWTAGFVGAVGLPFSAISGAAGAVVALAVSETIFAVLAWRRFAISPVPAQEVRFSDSESPSGHSAAP